MSERYWITGAQPALLQQSKELRHRRKIVEDIVKKQFIGNFYTENQQKEFKRKVEELRK